MDLKLHFPLGMNCTLEKSLTDPCPRLMFNNARQAQMSTIFRNMARGDLQGKNMLEPIWQVILRSFINGLLLEMLKYLWDRTDRYSYNITLGFQNDNCIAY